MSELREPLTLPEVARALRKSATWFTRHWKNLVADHGFPEPLPGLGKLWDPAAIEAWFLLQRPVHLRPVPTAVAAESDAGARLDASAARLAADLAEKAGRGRRARPLTAA